MISKKRLQQRRVLVIDVGGGHVKLNVWGSRRSSSFKSGTYLDPPHLVERVLDLTSDWHFNVVSLGYPGIVVDGVIVNEPKNLGCGWTGFDFETALRAPVQIVNDAVMQAIGSYRGGRMLFMGLGTGVGTVLMADGVITPMELAHRPFTKRGRYGTYIGDRSRRSLGLKLWTLRVLTVVRDMQKLLHVEYVVIGGGNARRLNALPSHVFRGHNDLAFKGGYRLWLNFRTRSRTKRI
jgi:polyphosphate glucokinase